MPRPDPIVVNIETELEEFVEKAMKKLTLDITDRLVKANPVDTGWSRANWVPSIGIRFDELAGSYEDAALGSINQQPQQQGIAAVAARYNLSRGSIFISNNVPYIGRLNNGSSSQAPSAFVQLAIAQALQEARQSGYIK